MMVWLQERVLAPIVGSTDHEHRVIVAETQVLKSMPDSSFQSSSKHHRDHDHDHDQALGLPIPVEQHPNVHEAWSEAFDAVDDALSITANKASRKVGHAVHAVEQGLEHGIKQIEDTYDTVKDTAMHVGHQGLQQGKHLVHGIGHGLRYVGEEIELGIEYGLDEAEEALDTVKDTAKHVGQAALQKSKEAVGYLGKGASHLSHSVEECIESVKDSVDASIHRGEEMLLLSGNTVARVGESIKESVQDKILLGEEAVTTQIRKVQNLGHSFKESVQQGIHRGDQVVYQSVKTVEDSLVTRTRNGWNSLVSFLRKGISSIAHMVNTTAETIAAPLSRPPRPLPRIVPTTTTHEPPRATAALEHPPPSSAQQAITVHRYGYQPDVPNWEAGISRVESEHIILGGIPPPMVLHRETTINVAPATPAINMAPVAETRTADSNKVPRETVSLQTQQPTLGGLSCLYLLIFTILYFILARRLWQERRTTGVYVGDGSYEMAREAMKIEAGTPTHSHHSFRGESPRTPPHSSSPSRPVAGASSSTTASIILSASQDKSRQRFRQLVRLRKTVEALASYVATALIAQFLILFLDLLKGPVWMIHIVGVGALLTSWLNIEGGIFSADAGGDNRVAANVILLGLIGESKNEYSDLIVTIIMSHKGRRGIRWDEHPATTNVAVRAPQSSMHIFPFAVTAATAIVGLAMFIGSIYCSYKPLCHSPLPADPPFTLLHSSHVKTRDDHRLRIVYKQHRLGYAVPLIVFLHGLGGNLQQWDDSAQHLSQMCSVLAIDLVGHGRADKCSNWVHYTTVSIADDIVHLISTHFPHHRELVFIAHSYGACLTTSILSRHDLLKASTKAAVFLAPKAHLSEHDISIFRSLLKTPNLIIDLARCIDRWGGAMSPSVRRVLSDNTTSADLRHRQLAWNKANTTPVLKKCAAGLSWVSTHDYYKLTLPVLLVTGEDDRISPLDNIEKLYSIISQVSPRTPEPFVVKNTGHNLMCEKPDVICAFISSFLVEDCKLESMSLKDQILRESQAVVFEKWSLKNYAKWAKIANVSGLIGRTKLRGMKVLKQDDPIHTPKRFARDYPNVGGLIDISLDDHPPYASADFQETQIDYIKLPTVSKIPPSLGDVKVFIDTVKAFFKRKPDAELAVNCHYGFNRTGFMITSYLIEVEHYSVSDALAAFAQARPPGVKHLHFKDTLYTRYEAPLSKLNSPHRSYKPKEPPGVKGALSDMEI
ncbi:hypothetical protein SeMB42_g06780 [Synchytrium endobioticum]|uniref:Tyrosine specific protein phosphatases domain-containing protein n=1 Tax=Synchytrium endobioticum TaxID=286115 RepID=A0A507CF12_9FUNG|nr:hypothetical protein SeMB42_g06780 [Synchytrium endobioticum]